MKVSSPTKQHNGLPFILTFALMAILFFHTENMSAMPRSPLPPVPELAPLLHETFDEDYSFGVTDSELMVPPLGILDESWSGYALARGGSPVAPFTIPALDAGGQTNVSSDTGGAIRFWLRPYWSGQSVTGGAGPGTNAVLLDFEAVSGAERAFVWALGVSADGDTIKLVSQTDDGPETVIEAPIAWTEGESHCVVLDFNTDGTALVIDGNLVGRGAALPSIPCSVGQLTVGSAFSGARPADADFDELFSFARPLTQWEINSYLGFTYSEAEKGPITGDELAAMQAGRMGLQMSSIRTPANVFDPDGIVPCNPGGPVYLTNLVAFPGTNGTMVISFAVQGGVSGEFYDAFTTTDLGVSLASNQWTWLGQVETCNGYVFSNQPASLAFYVLVQPSLTAVWAWGDNSYGECNVPATLTNAIAVAAGDGFSVALRGNGTVVAWGDNTYGQTNVPSGLSNVVNIAAGDYHGLAQLTNGAIVQWGSYWDGVHYTNVPAYAPYSNLVAVAGSIGHDIGLKTNGTVVTWGLTNDTANFVPVGVTNIAAIGCGWEYNVALSSNGTVQTWGDTNDNRIWGYLNYPTNLTNAVGIGIGPEHAMAIRANGTVVAWGYGPDGETNVPAGLSNIVELASGGNQSLALKANGNVATWGLAPEGTVPTNMAGIKALSAGFRHNLAIASGILNPIIFTQPVNQYAPVGGSVTFSATGQGVAGVQYQWQFDGVNLTGKTNSTLVLTNVQATNVGSYDVVVSSAFGTITSSVATFTLVLQPQIISTTPPAGGVTWINYYGPLTVNAYADGELNGYPLSYGWSRGGTNLGNYSQTYYPGLNFTNEGQYTVSVTNVAGHTNATWNLRLALPGMVEAWGEDDSGECDRPSTLTNAIGIAAGEYQSVAVTETGSILQWGEYSDGSSFYSVTNLSVASQPPGSNVVAVAAGLGQGLALLNDGTVRAWGLNGAYGTSVPTNATGVKAVACGWQFDVALLTNGTVRAWGLDDPALGWTMTNVPANLSNVTAIASGPLHTLALRSDGTVVGWGYSPDGETNIPSGLSNVVAIAAGESHNLALLSSGKVIAWGLNDYGQTNVPAGLSSVMAVAAGDNHSVALKNDGTLVEWGDNSSGQTNVPSVQPTSVLAGSPPSIYTVNYPPVVVRQIAAAGDHTVAAIFNRLLQYPINVSKDLLLIYNATNISYSSNVCAYYMAHRPMVSTANRLGISMPTNEFIYYSDYATTFAPPVLTWLSNNPTLRPRFVILFQDLPSLIYLSSGSASVQYDLALSTGTDPLGFVSNFPSSWMPIVTSINMNGIAGTNDCTGYIDKIARIASNNPPGSLIVSGLKAGLENTNWYFDGAAYTSFAAQAALGVSNALANPSVIYLTNAHIYSGTNVAGYWCPGNDGGLGGVSNSYATNGQIVFHGTNNWFIMASVDSYNGDRVPEGDYGQSGFLTWFAANAFGGLNYTNAPVGVVDHVDEPTTGGQEDTYTYYRDWAFGKPFGVTAWDALFNNYYNDFIHCAVVGDPFVSR